MKRQVLIATFIVAFVSCRGAEGKPADPPSKAPAARAVTDVTAQDYVMPQLPHARVTVSDAYGGKHVVEAEVALNRDARTRGMMWRRSLEDGKGMIFFFPVEQPVSFWMRNTLISLDMIFITGDRKVAGCVERAEPLTETPQSVGKPSQYVLEVPAGWCAKMGIAPGRPVLIEGVEGLRVSGD